MRDRLLQVVCFVVLAAAAGLVPGARGQRIPKPWRCPWLVNGLPVNSDGEAAAATAAAPNRLLMEVVVNTDTFPCSGHLTNLMKTFYVRSRVSDIWVLRDVCQDDEFGTIAAYMKARQPPTRIMDLGANIGIAAMYWASAFPKAQVLSVEPSMGNLAVAQMNTREFPNIRLIHGAIWERDSIISINVNHNRGEWGHFVSATPSGRGLKPGHAIPGYSVDSLMKKMGWDTIDYLKVDIETGEFYLFNNQSLSTGWLHKVTGCISIELHENFMPGCCKKPFEDAVASHGFKYAMNTTELQVWCRY